MKLMMQALLLVMLIGIIPVSAESTAQYSVSVNHSGSDIIGKRLAFELKEALRRSESFQLNPTAEAMFRISLVTLDPDKDKSTSDMWTVASVVITMRNYNTFNPKDPQTWYPIFLTTLVATSGYKTVGESAQNILASLDEAIEALRADVAKHSQE